MGQALYRKYRSRSLDEIVGQEHITTTLANSLKTGKVSHAYLFTGPRGTGKTSIARILAHELNHIPYSETLHFDIIEIDAASNNGVEDVRELREKLLSTPTSARYKVYIIDEVHMLSKPAFNALLKTLEEPPEHVIFILATTEAHKLPATIVSRTQRYSFRPVPIGKVTEHLKHIAAKEKITIDEDALRLIAEHGEGSFRDSISLLDQAASFDSHVTVSQIDQLLGRVPAALIDELLLSLIEHRSDGIIKTLRDLYDAGYEPAMISIQLGAQLRAKLGKGEPVSDPATIDLLYKLLAVPASHSPAQLLELTLLDHSLAGSLELRPSLSNEATATDKQRPKTPVAIPDAEAAPPSATNPSQEPPKTVPETVPLEDKTKSEIPIDQPDDAGADHRSDITNMWQEVLQTIKQSHNTLYGIARMAKPSLDGDILTLLTKFPFHQKRLSETKNSMIIAERFSTVRGRKTKLLCIITDTPSEIATPQDSSLTTMSAISNIFGGAELLD